MFRRIAAGGSAATRALAALVVIAGSLTAVAYAATGPGRVEGGGAASVSSSRGAEGAAARSRGTRPPPPRITRHPRKASTSATATFAFKPARGKPGFQCRLDSGDWRKCQSPVNFRGVGTGDHRFSVRVVARSGRRSAAARFRWKRVEPKSFAIEPQLSGLGPLYPGAPPQSLPLVLRNPNPVPILVTGLRVTVTAESAGCDSATNLALTPSSASAAAPLVLPAGGSVDLPAATVSAPRIALRDLPVNQDDCKGAQFPLAFSGEAHG
jgi:hypothetical protein